MSGARRVPDGEDSDLAEVAFPKKLRTGEQVTLDVTMLRQLLAEQTEGLRESNQGQLDMAVKRLEDKQKAMLQMLHHRIDETSTKLDNVESREEDFEKRLSKLEQGGSTRAGSDSSAASRQTLVFGGWGKDSRRQTILQELDAAIGRAQIRTALDEDPFTTGARRQVSLCNFFLRTGENLGMVKRRVFSVIQACNEGNYKTGARKRIWVSFSKTKPERLRGAHASWVRRILAELQIDLAHVALDVEYGTASMWLGASKITGLEKLDTQEGIYVDDWNPEKPYIHMAAMARELGISEKTIR